MYILMYISCMSRKYSIAEARARLPAIIDQAEAGQEIEVTRRGKPVVEPVQAKVRHGRDEDEDLRQHHEQNGEGQQPCRQTHAEGRRGGRRCRRP